IRIFVKQCRSLQGAGDAVTLYVADGRGDEVVDGVQIRDVGKPRGGRAGRAVFGSLALWRALRRVEADVAPVHDPELLPLALWLRLCGVRVVFDMHENLPKEILTKPWVAKPIRRVLSACVGVAQRFVCRRVPTVFAEMAYAADFPGVKEGVVV